MAEKKKAEAVNEYGQTKKEYEAAHSPEPKASKADLPDTPSGQALAAGKEGEEYQEAKRKARWG